MPQRHATDDRRYTGVFPNSSINGDHDQPNSVLNSSGLIRRVNATERDDKAV